VKSRGGLVQNVQRSAGGHTGQLRGKLHTLCLAPGQGVGGLTDLDIAQAHVLQGLQLPLDAAVDGEELHPFVHGHFQNVVNALALVFHLQGLTVVPLALTHVAGDVHVGEEVHLDEVGAVAAAGLASAALYVEGEAAVLVAPGLGLGGGGKHGTDLPEHPRIGGGVGAGGTPDGRLVDLDHLVDVLSAQNLLVLPGNDGHSAKLPRQGTVEDQVHQGGFPRPGNARHAGEGAQGEVHGEIFQIVFGSAHHGELVAVTLAAYRGNIDPPLAREVLPRERCGTAFDVLRLACVDDLAPVDTRLGAHVHQEVRTAHGLLVVLHHDHGVAQVAELLEGVEYYRYLAELDDNFDDRYEQLVEDLKDVLGQVLRRNSLVVNYTSDKKPEDMLKSSITSLSKKLSTRLEFENPKRPELLVLNEGFKTSSQVQYVATAGNFRDKGLEYNSALSVLQTIFSYDYLWLNVRVKGGAYGCMCAFARSGNGYFTSYRDPNLMETYDIFKKAAEYVRNFDADDRDMTKYIIGAISKLDAPLTPSAEGNYSYVAYLMGLTDEDLQRDRDGILNSDVKTIRELAPYIEAITEGGIICAIGGESKLDGAKDNFKEVVSVF